MIIELSPAEISFEGSEERKTCKQKKARQLASFYIKEAGTNLTKK
jgi:hypothetical protein